MMLMEWILVILAVALAIALLLLLVLWNKMKTFSRQERMRVSFLRNIDHEIRVPLKSFISLASTVGKEDLYLSKSEKRNISEQMVFNANLIGTLVDEMMMFSEASESGHQLLMESFSPNALCRRCLQANMMSIYHRKAVKLSFKRELSDEFFVKSDRHMVELIVNKLVINACKFTEEGEIKVGCNTTEHPDLLTIYISDSGRGIPQNRLGNIFAYFDKPDDLQDEAELDLSICRQLALKLGGELQRDSLFEEGTRMMLILPLR
jgi:signal transduction histidine kinase